MVSGFRVKHEPSLLAEKILHHVGFFPSKDKVHAWFLVRLLIKSAEFFFFLATVHSQKMTKEIAYIPTSYQALLKAQFFYFVYLFKMFAMNFNWTIKTQ